MKAEAFGKRERMILIGKDPARCLGLLYDEHQGNCLSLIGSTLHSCDSGHLVNAKAQEGIIVQSDPPHSQRGPELTTY